MIHREIRERLEALEEGLSPYAMRSRLSRGREWPEEPCPMRTAFQQDRDRIIHSKAFRRLKHKTQVFIAPQGDHFVTRLTHTLEVAQIARSIARALKLNEDLTEAISLGHDLGHPPFGHIGEEVLHELYPPGFEHSQQSRRVVDILEREGQGLNLTWEVREGILHHSKSASPLLGWEPVDTLEAQVSKLADAVAYINHDIGDALRAGLIGERDLPASALSVLGGSTSERINTLVMDIVDTSWAATGLVPGEVKIAMSPAILEAANLLRDFLFHRVYAFSASQPQADLARRVVRRLYRYFVENPHRLPLEYVSRQDVVERGVVDYIAGMTDQFALRLAAEIDPSHFRPFVDPFHLTQPSYKLS